MPYSVSPTYIKVDFNSTEPTVFDVVVRNTGNDWGMYKIKTNGKREYSARPRAGFIAGGETITICLKYKKQKSFDEHQSKNPSNEKDVLAILARDLIAEENSMVLHADGNVNSKNISSFVSSAWDRHAGHDSATIMKIRIQSDIGSSPRKSFDKISASNSNVLQSQPVECVSWSERTISLHNLSHALLSPSIDEVHKFESSSSRVLVTYKDRQSTIDALKSIKRSALFNPINDLLITIPNLSTLQRHLKCAYICGYVNTGQKMGLSSNCEISYSSSSDGSSELAWKIMLEPLSCCVAISSNPACSNISDLCSVVPATVLRYKRCCLTVHGGLWNSALQMYPAIKHSLLQLLPKLRNTVTVTGHGKSGAYAQAITMLIASDKVFSSVKNISTVTFGSPKFILSVGESDDIGQTMTGLDRIRQYNYIHIDDPVAALFTIRHDDVVKHPTVIQLLTACMQHSNVDIGTYAAVGASVYAIPNWMRIKLKLDCEPNDFVIDIKKPYLSRSGFSVAAHDINSYVCFLNDLIRSRNSPKTFPLIMSNITKRILPIKKRFLFGMLCAVMLLGMWYYPVFYRSVVVPYLFDSFSFFYSLLPDGFTIPTINEIDDYFIIFDEWLQETITWTSLVSVVMSIAQWLIEAAVLLTRIILGLIF